MLALIKAVLVHFGARNKMAPGLVCETIGALKEMAYALSFKAMRGTYLVHPLATVCGEPRVLSLSLHSHHTRSRTFPRIRLSVVARGYTNMAVAGGVPALRVVVLAMTAALQSLMPQKVVDRSQDGAEPGEHVD